MSKGPGATQRVILGSLSASGGRLSLAKLERICAAPHAGRRRSNLRRSLDRLEKAGRVVVAESPEGPERTIVSLPAPLDVIAEDRISSMLSELTNRSRSR